MTKDEKTESQKNDNAYVSEPFEVSSFLQTKRSAPRIIWQCDHTDNRARQHTCGKENPPAEYWLLYVKVEYDNPDLSVLFTASTNPKNFRADIERLEKKVNDYLAAKKNHDKV